MYKKFDKRLADVLFSALALVIFAIPMLFIAVIIKISSKGSVLFWQKRIGKTKAFL